MASNQTSNQNANNQSNRGDSLCGEDVANINNKNVEYKTDNIDENKIKEKEDRTNKENEDKQQQDEAVEEKQQDEAVENKKQDEAVENKKLEEAVENKKLEEAVENKKQEKAVEGKQQDEAVENKKQEEAVEEKQQDEAVEDKQQDEDMESKQGYQNEEESISYLQRLLAQLGLPVKVKNEQILSELTVQGIADFIKSSKCNKIIVMTGAGISTAAGIPDFRSPGTGLYSQLEKYDLPYPESIFELSYFRTNPEPFFLLAKELYPGNYKPTTSHYFLHLLEQKELLLRSYTQNIDGLELVAGLNEDLLIAAHGTFHTSHCLECKQSYSEQWMRERIFAHQIPKCKKCEGLVKPDIVFFGESLPEKFFMSMKTDFSSADLLIVMGTSLTVQPFASLIDRVNVSVPRLLINKQKCGQSMFSGGFDFDSENKYRDVVLLGDCDEGCLQLAELLGWKNDLLDLMNNSETDVGG